MKASTKCRKQLGTVKDWLAKARPELYERTLRIGWQPEFSLLIAVEQLVVYLELLEQTLKEKAK